MAKRKPKHPVPSSYEETIARMTFGEFRRWGTTTLVEAFVLKGSAGVSSDLSMVLSQFSLWQTFAPWRVAQGIE